MEIRSTSSKSVVVALHWETQSRQRNPHHSVFLSWPKFYAVQFLQQPNHIISQPYSNVTCWSNHAVVQDIKLGFDYECFYGQETFLEVNISHTLE